MQYVKTLKSGVSMDITVNYQDSDGTPNLFLYINVQDGSGKDVDPRLWDKEIMNEYDKMMDAFTRARFGSASNETVVPASNGNRSFLVSMGLEHPKIRSKTALEAEGARIMTGQGYENPAHSMVFETPKQARGAHAAKLKSPEDKPKPIDGKALRTEIEDLVTKALGNTGSAMKLTDDVMSAINKKLGLEGRDGPK